MINRLSQASLQTSAFLAGFSFGYFVARPLIQEVAIRIFQWEKGLKEGHRNFFIKEFSKAVSPQEKEEAMKAFATKHGARPLPVLSACSLAGIFASVAMAHIAVIALSKKEVHIAKGIFSAAVSFAGMSAGALMMPWAKRSAIFCLQSIQGKTVPNDVSSRSSQGLAQAAFVHLCEVASVVGSIFLFHSFTHLFFTNR